MARKEDEQPRNQQLVERLKNENFKSKVIKRASQLLNPLENHPFLRSMQAGVTKKFPGDEFFSRSSALAVKERAKKAEKKKEGSVAKIAERAADKGIVLLTQMLQQPGVTRQLEQTKPFADYHAAATSLMNGTQEHPEIKASLSVIKLVTEYMGQTDPNRTLRPEQKFQLFAAAVGYAQTVIVDILDLSKDKKRNQIRDMIIAYGLLRLQLTGQDDIAKYLIIQKAAK